MEVSTNKKLQRLQRKKAKIEAFLNVARLNDKDKKTKLQTIRNPNDKLKNINSNNIMESSNRKRYNEEIHNTNSIVCNEKEDESIYSSDKRSRLCNKEYVKLKQELKEHRTHTYIPNFILNNVGANAVIDIENIGKIVPIFLSDVQHFLLYSLFGQATLYLPRWFKLEKHKKISHTVVFIVEGLSSYHFITNESMFPNVKDNLKYRLEVVTPATYGGSIVEEFAAIPLTTIHNDNLIKRGCLKTILQMDKDIMKLLGSAFQLPSVINNVNHLENNNLEEKLPSMDKFSRTKLLLSLEQMVQENYPVPLKGILARSFSSYVLTKDSYEEVTTMSPMFALDCEMCLTTSNCLELTRISIVDEDMNVIYDTLVKPKNAIVNYLTRYSGITKEMLSDVTVTLRDVQQTLRTLLPANAILVGHTLNSDLHSLKMMHPYIIDISVIFNLSGDRSRKTKLQTLVYEFLREEIQNSKTGHCSIEDSRATMKLVKLKLANSLNYGDMVMLAHYNIQKMGTNKISCQKNMTRTKGTTIAIVGTEEIISEYSKYLTNSSLKIIDKNFIKDEQVHIVIADNNKNTVKRTSEIVMEHDFTLCHVKIRDEQLQDEVIEKTLHKVNKWVGKLWKYSAINSLSCVIFGGVNAANGTCFLNIKTKG